MAPKGPLNTLRFQIGRAGNRRLQGMLLHRGTFCKPRGWGWRSEPNKSRQSAVYSWRRPRRAEAMMCDFLSVAAYGDCLRGRLTTAGQGIDLPNVRYVVQLQLPEARYAPIPGFLVTLRSLQGLRRIPPPRRTNGPHGCYGNFHHSRHGAHGAKALSGLRLTQTCIAADGPARKTVAPAVPSHKASDPTTASKEEAELEGAACLNRTLLTPTPWIPLTLGLRRCLSSAGRSEHPSTSGMLSEASVA